MFDELPPLLIRVDALVVISGDVSPGKSPLELELDLDLESSTEKPLSVLIGGSSMKIELLLGIGSTTKVSLDLGLSDGVLATSV